MEPYKKLCTGVPRGNVFGFSFHKSAFFLIATFLVQDCLFAPPVSAEIYQWQAADGTTFYGDSPPSEVKAEEKHIRANKIVRPETKEPSQGKRQITKESRLRDASDISVIFYMTDWCPYCKRTRDYLNSKGIRFVEYDIDKDKNRQEEMRSKSGQKGVPVLDIEGIIVPGFNPNGISAAIEKKRKESN